MAWKDFLPDLPAALNNFYDERLKDTIETKSGEYQELFTKHLTHWHHTQQALIAIALAIFLLLVIVYFWKD